MGVTKVRGLDDVIRNLNKEIKSIERDVQKGLTLGMQMVKRDSMIDTPVDTGNLRGSHYVVSGNGQVSQESGQFTTVDKKGKPDKSGIRVSMEHPTHIAAAKANAMKQNKPFCEIGCTAFYAEIVHEDMEASHVKEHKSGGTFQSGKAKFLEDSIKKNGSLVLNLIKQHAKR